MTREQAKNNLQSIVAFAEGKKMQFLSPYGGGWRDSENMVFDVEGFKYRVKPEPSYRPWTPEEVLIGVLIKNEYLRSSILACDKSGIIYVGHCDSSFTVYELFAGWKYTTDNGKTWQPCGVLV